MKKCANAYLKKDSLYLSSSAETVMTSWTSYPPYYRIDALENIAEISDKIVECLDASTKGVPLPDKSDDVGPFAPLAKVQDWKAFAIGSKYCLIMEENDQIKLFPTSRKGEGFDYIASRLLISNRGEGGELTKKLFEAFDRSRG